MQSQVCAFLAGGSLSASQNGQLITLSAGALMIDVLETLRDVNEEFEFDDHKVNVWCNGNLASPEQSIKNGDVILTQPTPSLMSPVTEILVNKTSSQNTIPLS